jgi:hybrid cluster-associated redox disulfide protein
MPKITKDMKLGEIVEKFPNTVQVMLEHGLHCVGCHVAAYETLEQGCKAHGMSDEEIEGLLKKMNETKKGG